MQYSVRTATYRRCRLKGWPGPDLKLATKSVHVAMKDPCDIEGVATMRDGSVARSCYDEGVACSLLCTRLD